ncbi:MAG: hypothetical protein ACI94Y_000824 [Maribacter sp.]|jgi:hypothetical protein
MIKTVTIEHSIGFHAELPVIGSIRRIAFIGSINKNAKIPITEEVDGVTFEKELTFSIGDGTSKKFMIKSSKWLKDMNGWWYWGGATTTLKEAEAISDGTIEPAPSPVLPGKTFDWNEKMKRGGKIPSSWFEHQGEGLNIAILDAGFNLEHESFQDINVKTYDMSHSRYDKKSDLQDESFVNSLDGKDKVFPKSHGTACLSIMGSNASNKEIMGLIPKANFHLFNVYRHKEKTNGGTFARQSKPFFERAIWIISLMDIDVVSVSVNYSKNNRLPVALLQKIEQKNTLWFWALKNNSTLLDYVGNLTFPSIFFSLQTIAVLEQTKLASPNTIVRNEIINEKVDYILQKSTISVVKNKENIDHNTTMSCSYATPILVGLAALKINEEKSKNPDFKVDKNAFFIDLKKEVSRFYKDFIPDNDTFTFLNLIDDSTVS